MIYPHVISSFESEVASLKVEEIFSQEIESLHPLRLSSKLPTHNYVLVADYNQSSEFTDISQWVNFILGNRSLVYCIIIYFKFKRSFVYFDCVDINSCWKCLSADDSTGRKFVFC